MLKKLHLLLFLLPVLSFAQWTQVGSTLVGEAAGNAFGFSLSLSSDGNMMAVGAIENSAGGFQAGHVRVFENSGGTWLQVGSDIDGATGDYHGYSVSLSSDGSILAVGAVLGNKVKVYQNIGGTWTQIGNTINGQTTGDQFGFSVDLSDDGTILAIGGRLNADGGQYAGHVRVYQFNGSSWTQIGPDIDGNHDVAFFGSSVSLSADGTILAVSAPNNGPNGSNSGYVRVFQNTGNTWTQIGTDLVGAANDLFGATVSLNSNGTILAVGSNWGDYAKIYENISGTWTQLGNTITAENVGDRAGAVSINSDGSVVAVGSIYSDENGTSSGQARVFRNMGGTWTQLGNDIEGTGANDVFGGPLRLSDDGSVLAIAGAYNDDNGTDSGHVRVYTDATLSVADVSENQTYRLFPNPATNTIQLQNLKTSVSYKIYNVLGAEMQRGVVSNNERIDITNVSKGVYILKFDNGNTLRFIKQ